ncbi:hypothetical protein ACNKHO_16805 [Shigella flexneri]
MALRQRQRISASIWKATGSRKPEIVRALFACAGITPPTREMWLQLREDVMRYGLYNQNLQAVPPTAPFPISITPRRAFTRSCVEIEIRKEGKTGASTTPHRL